MDIRITHRVEGEAKPASGLVGALGGAIPASVEEITIEANDVEKHAGLVEDIFINGTSAIISILDRDQVADEEETPKTLSGEAL